MSEFALKVKEYYDKGLWSAERVDKALELKRITKSEYNEILQSK